MRLNFLIKKSRGKFLSKVMGLSQRKVKHYKVEEMFDNSYNLC